jgi:hypothetical protein
MMRVFIDTNILIDYALGREHGEDAEQLLLTGGQTPCEVKTPYPSSPAQQGNTPCAGGFPYMSLDDNQGNKDNFPPRH